MSDITYRLYAKADGHREVCVAGQITGWRHRESGALNIYQDGNTNTAYPDVIYAPGQWTRLVKNEEER